MNSKFFFTKIYLDCYKMLRALKLWPFVLRIGLNYVDFGQILFTLMKKEDFQFNDLTIEQTEFHYNRLLTMIVNKATKFEKLASIDENIPLHKGKKVVVELETTEKRYGRFEITCMDRNASDEVLKEMFATFVELIELEIDMSTFLKELIQKNGYIHKELLYQPNFFCDFFRT